MEPLHRQLGLTDSELERIVELLGRSPSDLEVAMYAVMWSEHCSYKSSRQYLGRFPTEAPWVLVGPGEGAGVIDVGDGLALAIRIESHNHPSAIEPHEGAATGVGGIIRDIFSMGARPIALMDSLRFGPLDQPRNRYLTEGVVSGISGYGNAVGVPTVGGEAVFDDCYSGNPLVNVLCLGILPKERLVLARAEGEGNLAVLLGASTGRDGIGGASVLASAAFEEGSEDSGAKRPSVQVGDPFEEKKLIEACIALLDAGLAVGVQDLGAAGLSCAASETAAKGGVGMDVDVARVPQRESKMNVVEIMTSESQERMLAIIRPENLDKVTNLCERWEIRSSVVGRVTGTGRFRVFDGLFDSDPNGGNAPSDVSSRTPLADVPAGSLGDGPIENRPRQRPVHQDELQAQDPWTVLERRLGAAPNYEHELLSLLATPTIADKSWIWQQYDHQLFLNTVIGPGADATVLRLPGSSKALALSVDGKARHCSLDPRVGGRLVVAEAARNVACAGARPLALVNCLNFGNPEHPEVMWQFAEVVEGISEACEALGIPVVGGNVSFYNTSDGVDIHPTPVVGVVGLIDLFDGTAPPLPRVTTGEQLIMLGTTRAELGGSEWAAVVHGLSGGRPPEVDLVNTAATHELVRALVTERLVAGVHDCADGGLGVCVAEMAIASGVGIRLDRTATTSTDLDVLHPAVALFSESASRVLLSVPVSNSATVVQRANDAGVLATVIGEAVGDRLVVDGVLNIEVGALADTWRSGLRGAMSVR